MQIVIDIPKEVRDIILRDQKNNEYLNIYERAIANGTPLPKNHGRLIDADALLEDCWWETEKEVSLAPTVLEANNANSN